MSFKAIREFLKPVWHFGDIGKVLDQLEKDYQLKSLAINSLSTRKITLADFKRQFFYLTDEVENKIKFLENTFSHDKTTLEIIKKFEKNIQEQKQNAFGKKPNIDFLIQKLKEEREILEIEEKIIQQEKTKQTIEQKQITQTTFEQIQFEPTASKAMSFNNGLLEIRKRGYERHPRPQEEFALIMAYLEGSLSPKQYKIAANMSNCAEWISCAFEIQKNTLFVYLDPEGIVWNGEKYVKQIFSYADKKEFNITEIPLLKWISIKTLPAELIQYFYGRKLENLPQRIQQSQWYLSKQAEIQPICRGSLANYYVIDTYDLNIAASRGIVSPKKIINK